MVGSIYLTVWKRSDGEGDKGDNFRFGGVYKQVRALTGCEWMRWRGLLARALVVQVQASSEAGQSQGRHQCTCGNYSVEPCEHGAVVVLFTLVMHC